MIRLSADGKTFVEVKTWDDVLSRPGFRQKLEAFALKQIIGQYSLSPAQPCGIKSCGTKHNRGYLVDAGGGIETNIGNVCGKRIFGVEFTRHQKAFKREMNAERYREEITAAQHRLNGVVERVLELRKGEFGADSCYEKMHAQMTKYFPDSISKPLVERAQRSNAVVSRQVRLTASERETAQRTTAQGGRTEFRSEAIFVVAGLRAVVSYRKIRTLTSTTFGDELAAFRNVVVAVETFSSLQRWHNWANRLELRIKELQDITADCNRFLVPSNIQAIRKNQAYLAAGA